MAPLLVEKTEANVKNPEQASSTPQVSVTVVQHVARSAAPQHQHQHHHPSSSSSSPNKIEDDNECTDEYAHEKQADVNSTLPPMSSITTISAPPHNSKKRRRGAHHPRIILPQVHLPRRLPKAFVSSPAANSSSFRTTTSRSKFRFSGPHSQSSQHLLGRGSVLLRSDNDNNLHRWNHDPPAHNQNQDEPSLQVTVSKIASQKRTVAEKRNVDSHRILKLGYSDELERNYDFLSLFSITFAAVGFLPGTFYNVFAAYDTGGSGMISIAWPVSGLLMCTLAASMAELSSTWPVAGAMYSWTFVLCRSSPKLRKAARFLSWICGNFVLTGHLLAQMLLAYQFAIALQGTIEIFSPYQLGTAVQIVITCAAMVFCGIIVATPLSREPWLWKFASLALIVNFVFTISSLLISTKSKRPLSDVFSSYGNDTGFSSKVYVYLMGWCLTTLATGADAAAHLAEDAKRPNVSVPRAIFWSSLSSYALGWIAIVVMLICTKDAPPDGERYYFYAPTRILLGSLPKPVASLILIFLLINTLFQLMSQIMSASRFAWALARDSALPFSKAFRLLTKKHRIPHISTFLVVAIAIPGLLLLAVNRVLISSMILQTCGFLSFLGYAIPIAIYAIGDKSVLGADGRRGWSLRSMSMPAAWISIIFVAIILIIMSFPTSFPVTLVSFGWAPVIVTGITILTCLAWVLYGNNHFAGPIKSVTIYTMGQEADLKMVRLKEKKKSNFAKTTDIGDDKTGQVFMPTIATTRVTTATDSSTLSSTLSSEWDTEDEDDYDEEEGVEYSVAPYNDGDSYISDDEHSVNVVHTIHTPQQGRAS